jgi:RNA polymerase sigma factor for flagellar operon FliA
MMDMPETTQPPRYLPQTSTAPQSDDAPRHPASDEIEIVEELQLALRDNRQLPDHMRDFEVGLWDAEELEETKESEAGEPLCLPDQVEGVSLFPSRAAAQSIPALKLSAPNIERAVQALTAELGRAPNEVEIAGKLSVGIAAYRNMLDCLRELEVCTLSAERKAKAKAEEILYLPSGSNPLFCCLRSELPGMLRDAIGNLPTRERLVLCFYYYEELDTKSISVVLNLTESTVEETRVAAFMSIRASIATSMNRVEPELRRAKDEPPPESSYHEALVSAEEPTQIYVTGSNGGWKPTELPWKLCGWRATWDRFFRSWYLVNEKQQISQIKRQERHTNEVGF